MSKRYELRIHVEADDSVDPVQLRKVVSHFLNKSPKLEVKWFRLSEHRGPGRPAEVKEEIHAYLLTQSKPRSALQISKAISRAQTTCYKPLHTLVDEGKLEAIPDTRWRVTRYKIKQGDDDE